MINTKLLEQAQQKVPSPELLINIVTRRVRQLAQGHRPMVQTEPRMEYPDIALKEIVEGKLSFEVEETAEATEETGDAKL
jgi:DNA-directed RNA polymerase subunit omega